MMYWITSLMYRCTNICIIELSYHWWYWGRGEQLQIHKCLSTCGNLNCNDSNLFIWVTKLDTEVKKRVKLTWLDRWYHRTEVFKELPHSDISFHQWTWSSLIPSLHLRLAGLWLTVDQKLSCESIGCARSTSSTICSQSLTLFCTHVSNWPTNSPPT